MKDVEILLEDRPGELARMARALGAAGISIEGGGAWSIGGQAVAHFLFAGQAPVAEVLAAAGIRVVAEREVAMLRLDQARPGQLGAATGLMAQAGLNLLAQYSDHDHRLVLVAGLWAQPALATRLHIEPPGNLLPEKLARFVTECQVRFVGKMEKPKLKWGPSSSWNADRDTSSVFVAVPESCKLIPEPSEPCPGGLICSVLTRL